MNQLPIVTIIIATFNSGKLLTKILDGIVKQSYPRENIEILLVDGGSIDSTIEIGNQYNCKIINNPKTEPVNAKLLGMQESKGKFIIYLDHDELLENTDSIFKKVNALLQNPQCKVSFTSGYKRPKDYPFLNQYISEFGDPFSFFIYHFSKDSFYYEKVLRKNYRITAENTEYFIVDFSKSKKQPLIELLCMGTMIDAEYFKTSFPTCITDGAVLTQLFYLMLNESPAIIYSKDDAVIHYSADSIKRYLPKLRWRVCNNVHFEEKGKSGFTGREQYSSPFNKLLKILFIPYALTIVFSLMDALYLAISRKNPVYFLHPFFSFYIAIYILYHFFLKVIGVTPSFKSYDGKKIIKR